MPLWFWLLIAGVAGACVRAWRDHGQATWSRETLTDALVGGIASMFAPPAAQKLAPAWYAAFSAPHYQIIGVFVLGFVASATWLVMVRQRLPQFFAKVGE